MQRLSHWKRLAGISTVAFALIASYPLHTCAAENDSSLEKSGDILADIRKFTYETAQYAKSIDQNITLALIYMNEWLITPNAKDSADKTSLLQSNFATYTNTILTTTDINNTLQQGLTQDFLGSDVTPTTAPYTNDLTYQTLLGFPYFSPDPRLNSTLGDSADNATNLDPARNYIKNTAGLNIRHILPRDNWKGSDADKQRYKDFYNTVSSIQTFNIHVLGEIYADYKNGGAASAQQANLIQQASNSGWFSVVASEHIGLVLRQILMYNSQLLVVTSQLLQTQKEMLAAQAMTNSLLVLGNQFNETQLLNRATGQSTQ